MEDGERTPMDRFLEFRGLLRVRSAGPAVGGRFPVPPGWRGIASRTVERVAALDPGNRVERIEVRDGVLAVIVAEPGPATDRVAASAAAAAAVTCDVCGGPGRRVRGGVRCAGCR